MISKTVASALLVVLLVSNSLSLEQAAAPFAIKLTDVTEFGCCGLDLELSLLTDAVREAPGARAHIIGYSGSVDPPGKLLRYLQYIECNLQNALGIDSLAVSVINGGHREEFGLELWIVPKGANLPTPSPSIKTTIFDYRAGPVLFDESNAIIMDGGDDPSYLAFDLHCGLGEPLWGEFFRILENEQDIKGHVTICEGMRSKKARQVEKLLRSYLKEHFPKQAEQITIKHGGTRDRSELEIWLVPDHRANTRDAYKAKSTRSKRRAR